MKNKEFIAIEKKLLPELPAGFTIKGAMMVFGRVEHTLRAVLFERSGDARSFYVWVFFQPLYIPAKYIHLTLGRRLRYSAGGWNADDPALLDELTAVIKKEAVPFLNGVATIEGVLDYLNDEAKKAPQSEQGLKVLAYTQALVGNVNAARDALDRNLKLYDISIGWQKEAVAEAQLLKKLLDNPLEAKNQLMQWEAETVRNLKLEGLWQT
jgi:hypothetical protein